jgi:membrane protease YdiL (CAAX protease family)
VSYLKEFQLEILAWLGLAVVGGVLTGTTWLLSHRKPKSLLPRQRRRAVPWSGFDVLAVVFLYQMGFLWANEVLARSGLFSVYCGVAFPGAAAASTDGGENSLATARRLLWVTTLAFPIQLTSILLWFRYVSRARLYQLGLTRHRIVENVTAGFVTWLYLTPMVFAFNALVLGVYSLVFRTSPDAHPFTKLLEDQRFNLDWILVGFSAIVAAPMMEELLFRGLLQPWLMQRSWGGHAAMGGSFLVALLSHGDKSVPDGLQTGFPDAWLGLLDRLSPALFVLITVPGYVWANRLFRGWFPSQVARTIYATALLFAIFHASVWPSPVALFPLGLGLGILAYRTQSVLGPMVMHGLFNAVSCLTLVFAYVLSTGETAKGNEVTSAAHRPVAVSTSTVVPGSLPPRRRYASAIAPKRGEITDEVIWPTSLPSRNTLAPRATSCAPRTFKPRSMRLT